MAAPGLIEALRTGDEAAIWAAMDETIPGGLRSPLWDIHRNEALALLRRDGVATYVALSSHPDGHVREAALRALPPSGSAALLALLRHANDWVPLVARLATERAIQALRTADDEALAQALPLVFALSRQRQAEDFRIVFDYRREVARRKGLARRLRGANRSGPLGVWSFQNLLGEDDSPEAFAREVLRDAPLRVQAEAARQLAEDPAQWTLLMASRNPRVRRIGLDVAPETAREAALIDPDAGVRNDARDLLGTRDHAAYYRSLLPAPGAVSGLGETGTPDDLPRLRALFDHPRAAVRHRARIAFAALADDADARELLSILRMPNRKVQRAVLQALGRLTVAIDPFEAVDLGLETRAAWALMERAPRWGGLLAVLLRVETFPRADAWLVRWVERLFAHPMPPRPQEAADATVLVSEVAPLLPPATAAALREAIRPWRG